MPRGQAAVLTPSRLVIARKRRGLTLTQLAGLTGMSTRSISLYENGHQEPSADTLRQLALVLDVSPGFLRAPELDEIPEDAVSFRALSKMTARQRDRSLSAGRVALLINDWIDTRFRLPETDIPRLTGHDPEAAAEVTRARWGLGERPVSNVLHLLESRGARIYSLSSENAELDAYSLYWHGRPFIFLATGKTGERGRFDAAHELGHLVLHGEHQVPSRPAAEAEANRFAAAFLMPRASVLAGDLRDATPERIVEAKRTWKVSAMALAHRLHELDLLTEWGYRTACVQLARLGYRSSEPRGIERESSQLLAKVFRAVRDGGETPGHDRVRDRDQHRRAPVARVRPHPDRRTRRRPGCDDPAPPGPAPGPAPAELTVKLSQRSYGTSWSTTSPSGGQPADRRAVTSPGRHRLAAHRGAARSGESRSRVSLGQQGSSTAPTPGIAWWRASASRAAAAC